MLGHIILLPSALVLPTYRRPTTHLFPRLCSLVSFDDGWVRISHQLLSSSLSSMVLVVVVGAELPSFLTPFSFIDRCPIHGNAGTGMCPWSSDPSLGLRSGFWFWGVGGVLSVVGCYVELTNGCDNHRAGFIWCSYVASFLASDA